jgi:hypothetical protein
MKINMNLEVSALSIIKQSIKYGVAKVPEDEFSTPCQEAGFKEICGQGARS